MSVINPKAIVRRAFAASEADKVAASEGKFCTFDGTTGEIKILTAATTIPTGLVSDPDGSTAAAYGTASADVILPSFGGIVQVQVGSSPGTINAGSLLKVKADGTVMLSSSAANDVVVAMALEKLETTTAGQLIPAVLLTPYKVPAA